VQYTISIISIIIIGCRLLLKNPSDSLLPVTSGIERQYIRILQFLAHKVEGKS